MIGFEDTTIRKIAHHKVSSEEKTSIISDTLFDCSTDEEESVFKKLLLKPFTNHANTFEFHHEVDLSYNVLFNLAKNIRAEEDFIRNSKDIAQHLVSVSTHPNIKDGDVFIAAFEDLKLGNQYLDGLGIYKFEEKESFLETSVESHTLSRTFRKGIGNKKPDKACLILFTEEPFTLLVIDNNAKETDYWQNDFIQHKSRNDYINNTHDFLSMTKDYITSQIPNEFEVSKTDQIDLLNRSVDYFKSHETFEKQEFENEVFGDQNVIESFQNFDSAFRQQHEVEISDNFEISGQAVKKQARAFKSVLKLDKNFHIYIHGDKNKIERGEEADGRKFYKIYYDNEQ